MRFELNDLSKKSLSELRGIFASIPISDNEMILVGHFTKTIRFSATIVAEALCYLPRHVNVVKLGGMYAYSLRTSIVWSNREQERSGYYLSPRDTPRDGSGFETQSHYNRELGNLLQQFISSLPCSVTTLYLHFERDPHYENYHRRYRCWVEATSTVPTHFSGIFRTCPYGKAV